jgi:hypothetical protein
MNNTELDFINKYIVKEKKERLIYEFSNLKEKAILRFSHNINCLIKRNIKINKIRVNELINIKINKMVYIISLDKINGEYLLYSEAINHLMNLYMPVILIDDNFVIIKTENEYFYLT